MTPLLVSVSEAARLMGRSRRWMSRKLRACEIPFVPQGRRSKLVPVSALNAWIAKHTVSCRAELLAALDGRK